MKALKEHNQKLKQTLSKNSVDAQNNFKKILTPLKPIPSQMKHHQQAHVYPARVGHCTGSLAQITFRTNKAFGRWIRGENLPLCVGLCIPLGRESILVSPSNTSTAVIYPQNIRILIIARSYDMFSGSASSFCRGPFVAPKAYPRYLFFLLFRSNLCIYRGKLGNLANKIK